MSSDLDLLQKKAELIEGNDYKRIRQLQLERIVNLSNTQIDPVIFKGMVKMIYDTDQWKDDYTKAKKKGV